VKYAVEMVSFVMIYILVFTQIGSGIPKITVGGYKDTETV
jgi:hypothetical protein